FVATSHLQEARSVVQAPPSHDDYRAGSRSAPNHSIASRRLFWKAQYLLLRKMYILMRLYIEMSNRKYLLDRDKKLDKGWYPIPFLDEKDGICTVNFLGYTMFV